MSARLPDPEREVSAQIAEQLIRPTGLLDPEVEVRSTEGQIEDLISEINIGFSVTRGFLSPPLQRRWLRI